MSRYRRPKFITLRGSDWEYVINLDNISLVSKQEPTIVGEGDNLKEASYILHMKKGNIYRIGLDEETYNQFKEHLDV